MSETQELVFCEDCEKDVPRDQMSEKYYRMFKDEEVVLWCNECRDSYDPSPYEQWEVTTPSEVYTVVEDEHGRVY